MDVRTDLYLGDCKDDLQKIAENSMELIVASPHYADQGKNKKRVIQ